jgi:putative transposase
VADARRGIGKWVLFYNDERLHQALGYQTPREIFESTLACGHVDNARALTTCATGATTPGRKEFN